MSSYAYVFILIFLCLCTFMFISRRNSYFMKSLNTYAVAIRWQLPVTVRNLKASPSV